MNLSLYNVCKVFDGGVMALEQQDHGDDQRLCYSSPDIFSPVREAYGSCCVSMI
jgi:hypothetical protein